MKPFAAGITIAAAISAASVAFAAPPSAQPSPPPSAQAAPNGPPNALQGFSQNRDKPIKITSSSLEVRDRDKVATFSGDVHLVQGDTTLRSKTLTVFYDDKFRAQARQAATADSGCAGRVTDQPAIRRVEAKGGVLVTQKDQTATGESGIFDTQANTVTLLGNVVIAQGQNVVKGDRLTVDLTSGTSRVECGKSQGQCRVQALIQPNSVRDKPGAEPASTAASAPVREAPKRRPPSPAAGLY